MSTNMEYKIGIVMYYNDLDQHGQLRFADKKVKKYIILYPSICITKFLFIK